MTVLRTDQQISFEQLTCFEIWVRKFLSRLNWKAPFPYLSTRSKYYSKLEADFQRDWALFVEYLTALRFPTTLMKVSEFVKGMPQRILVDEDTAFFIRDFTTFQNIVLHVLSFLHKMHEYTGKRHLLIIIFYKYCVLYWCHRW